MPAHFVYDDPDKTKLCQGDVLRKTPQLLKHLENFHPYYAQHDDYKYFMVVTQSCDLFKRGSSPPTSRYISLCAVRPVEEALRREASKHQEEWQRKTGVVGLKTKDKLMMFVESLLDNNREGYFYLHADFELGIQQNCCAFLPLKVALKVEHYDLCLEAKLAQLKESFQAKLGYLLGHMYNRVGTVEWNDEKPDNKTSKVAKELLNQNFVAVDDRQISEGTADLRNDGTLATKSPDEIKEYIIEKKVVPRKEKFRARAVDKLSDEIKLIEMIRRRLLGPLKADADLQKEIESVLKAAGVKDADSPTLQAALIEEFLKRLSVHLSDDALPDKRQLIDQILAKLLQDPQISVIMS